jgi:hypothetical protein
VKTRTVARTTPTRRRRSSPSGDTARLAVLMLAIAACGPPHRDERAPAPTAPTATAPRIPPAPQACHMHQYVIRGAELRVAPPATSEDFYLALLTDVMTAWPRASWRQPTVPDLTAGEPWGMLVDPCGSQGAWVSLDSGGVHDSGGAELEFPDGHQIVAQPGTRTDLSELLHDLGASAVNDRWAESALYARLGPEVDGVLTLELGFSFESALVVKAPELARQYDAQLQQGQDPFWLDADHDGHVSLPEVLDSGMLRVLYHRLPASFDHAPAGPGPPKPDLANDRFSLFVRLQAVPGTRFRRAPP